MKKIFSLIMISVLFAGCSIRSKSYYLLDGATHNVQTRSLKESVGIETIALPRYFNQSSVAIKSGENRVTFLPRANWVSEMDAYLTGVLIGYLKRYFHSTDIYLFPWDVSKGVDKRVHIKIDNFIYHDKFVELDASWEISDKHGHKVAKFFHKKVPSTSDTDDIVKQMDTAFSALELAIAQSLS
jgi:uncharacterized lipoprotein YmbA